MQSKPQTFAYVRPMKTSTSEITAVHARVRVHIITMMYAYAACATFSRLLPLPEPRDLQLHNKTKPQRHAHGVSHPPEAS